jgi:hypothetical protein
MARLINYYCAFFPMALGEDFALYSLQGFEIVLSFILTLGLLSYVTVNKEVLMSDRSRKALHENIGLFWAVLIMLFTALVLFLTFETLDLADVLSEGAHSTFSSLRTLLVTLTFLILDLGLASAFWLTRRIRRARH